MEHAPRDVELLSVSKQKFDGSYVLGYHLDILPNIHHERAGAITTSLLVSNIDMKQSVTDLKESVADLKQIVADLKQNNDNLKQDNDNLKKDNDDLKKDNDDLKQEIFGLKQHVFGMAKAPLAIEGPQAVISPDIDVLKDQVNALQASGTRFQLDVEKKPTATKKRARPAKQTTDNGEDDSSLKKRSRTTPAKKGGIVGEFTLAACVAY